MQIATSGPRRPGEGGGEWSLGAASSGSTSVHPAGAITSSPFSSVRISSISSRSGRSTGARSTSATNPLR